MWQIELSVQAQVASESSPETNFIPKPCAETLPPWKYGRKRARVERDDYVSWNFSMPANNFDWSWLVALFIRASFNFPKTLRVYKRVNFIRSNMHGVFFFRCRKKSNPPLTWLRTKQVWPTQNFTGDPPLRSPGPYPPFPPKLKTFLP